jgi:hypothetical protein
MRNTGVNSRRYERLFGREGHFFHTMTVSLARVRWLRVLSTAIAVIVLSFVVLMFITAGYACASAYQARGAPDQSAISRFAAQISPRLMPWLECFLALALSFSVGRKSKESSTAQGLFIGILAGMLGLALALVFRGHVSSSSLIFSCGVALAGFIGGLSGQKWPANK